MRNVFRRLMEAEIEAYQPSVHDTNEIRSALVTMMVRMGSPIRASDVFLDAGTVMLFLEQKFDELSQKATTAIAEQFGEDWQQHRWDDDGNRLDQCQSDGAFSQ